MCWSRLVNWSISMNNLLFQSKPFWILAKGVRDFVENEGNGALPVRGSIPDMTAETSSYIALQQMWGSLERLIRKKTRLDTPLFFFFFCRYNKQAVKDADVIFRRVQQLLHELNQPSETITEADTRLFCRHAHDLHVIRGSSISDEYQGRNTNLQNLGEDRKLFCCAPANQVV